MRNLLMALVVLLISPARAEMIKIPGKGDYPHNGETVWSTEKKYHKSGLTRNFMNGAPGEHGIVQRDGFLQAEIFPPKLDRPLPFIILMHGCSGMADPTLQRWAHRLEKAFTEQGYGVLVLDSFTTRRVNSTCGPPNYHWGVRRAEDAYSALDYLVENKLAKPEDVFVLGRSNGAWPPSWSPRTMRCAITRIHFAASFARQPVSVWKTQYSPVLL